MQYSPRIPTSLRTRLMAEVRSRGIQRHQANVLAWAASNEGALPTLEEATATELATTELLLTALGDLALHAPDEVFPQTDFWDFTDPDWFSR